MEKQIAAQNKDARIWPRAVMLLDLNAFFASIEQRDFPDLRGKPVAVTNGLRGSCIITSSYEARAYGVKTGMRLAAAREHCPQLIQRPARPHHYGQVSKTLMQALQSITPDIEIFSVDEAFLEITHCQLLWGSPEAIAEQAQRLVWDNIHLPCSIGVGGDKTTAKFAAKLKKPNGITVIPPWEAKQRLANVPVTALCGIGKGIGRFLASHNVYTCGQMTNIPISVMKQRFGRLGTRLWTMCQGLDPDALHDDGAANKTLGHGKVCPPNTTETDVLLTYFIHMAEKVSARLRQHELLAQRFFVGVRSRQTGWCSHEYRLLSPTHDRAALFECVHHFIGQVWPHSPVDQVQITALDPHPAKTQLDLFDDDPSPVKQAQLNGALDNINNRYGKLTIAAGRLLNRSSMPDVIAPAWKPHGPKCSVDPVTSSLVHLDRKGKKS